MMFEHILVVCVGNICRSPMAMAVLRQRYPHKHIDSAGVGALVGHPADPLAIAVAAQHHLDLSEHRAKQIDIGLTRSADLILTMSGNQSKWIEQRWPHCRGKTFRIGHWNDQDIADPYQQDHAAFERAYNHILDSLNHWQDKLT